MKDEEVEEIIEKLQKYIDLDGTELGDCASSLIALYESYVDYVSPKFLRALELELKDQLNNFEENCEIVEREIEKKEVRKVKELVWKY